MYLRAIILKNNYTSNSQVIARRENKPTAILTVTSTIIL